MIKPLIVIFLIIATIFWLRYPSKQDIENMKKFEKDLNTDMRKCRAISESQFPMLDDETEVAFNACMSSKYDW